MSRPRQFAEQDVVARALDAFWQHGFEGTSLDVLESRTGLNRSSLYNTFGGKAALFCQALDAYSVGPCAQLFEPLRATHGAEALRGYLAGLSKFIGSPDASRGCLMVNTSIETLGNDDVRRRVDAHFRILRAGFERAYATGLEDHSVDETLTAQEAADWLLTIVRGVLVGAVGGETSAALQGSLATAAKQIGLG